MKNKVQGSEDNSLKWLKVKDIMSRFMRKMGLAWEIMRYNLKIIFANKFIFFLIGAVGFYSLITIIDLLDPESYFSESNLYNLLLFPGGSHQRNSGYALHPGPWWDPEGSWV